MVVPGTGKLRADVQDSSDAVFHKGATDILDAQGIDLPTEHRIVADDTHVEDGILARARAMHCGIVSNVNCLRVVSVGMGDDVGQGQIVVLIQLA